MTQRASVTDAQHQYDADVLDIGGGPAGTWAAISAAARGARVLLADKGFCGTWGATAPSGTGVWYVPRALRRHVTNALPCAWVGHIDMKLRWLARWPTLHNMSGCA